MKKLEHLCHVIGDKCFPTASDEKAHLLHEYFSARFCDKLHCDYTRSEKEQRSVNDIESAESSQKLYYVFVSFVVIFIVLFYIGMFIYKTYVE